MDISTEETTARRRRDREVKLIDETLSGGWVRVVLERDSIVETWFRSGDKPQEIQVVREDGVPEILTVAAAQQRFPARAFHQKELSTTMVDPEVAADNITGIAAAEILEEKRRNEQAISNAKRALTTATQQLAAHWQAELEHSQARSVVEDLRRRHKAISSAMEEDGARPEDLKTLAEAPRWDRALNYLAEVQRHVVAERERIQDLIASAVAVETSRYAEGMSFPVIQELAERVAETRVRIAAELSPALDLIDALETARLPIEATFQGEYAQFRTRYGQTKERQAGYKALIDESEKLGSQLRAATLELYKAASAEAVSRPALDRFENVRSELADLLEKRPALLKQAAEQVGEKSEGTLKARVKRDRKPTECVAALCALLEGSRIREPEQHCHEWVERAHKQGGAGWPSVCDALLEIYRQKILAGSPGEPGAKAAEAIRTCFFIGEVNLTSNQVSRLYANLNDHALGLVLAAAPKDTISLTCVSDGRDIKFGEASPGQQASALLRLLLRQEAGTLIIDQPEDDLDNRVIMDIVQLIQTSKCNRQLIFATHNPNLVVNGDADKVIALTSSLPVGRSEGVAAKIRVESDGAIETPAVRKAITHVMEGGASAFSLRARKYGGLATTEAA